MLQYCFEMQICVQKNVVLCKVQPKIRAMVRWKSYLLIKIFFLIMSSTSCGMVSRGDSDSSEKSDVIVTVDKDTLEINLHVDILNNLSDPIYCHIGSQTPVFSIKHIERKRLENHWDTLYAYCQYPYCEHDIDQPQVIQPQQQMSFTWIPAYFIDGRNKSQLLVPGEYRLLILYMTSDKEKWLTIYSDVFFID